MACSGPPAANCLHVGNRRRGLHPQQPIFHRIVRWERAIPQYHVGHRDRLARIAALAARHRGLFLAGNAYRGVALNDCTEQSEVLAREVVKYLAAIIV